jgi:L-seryl-tRNA(Ser) seleniumtransferase
MQDMIEVAHRYGLPIIVDAAAEVPPYENLGGYTSMGADLVAFSGGKAISGPNDTGILIGRKDLIEACAMNAFPENYPTRIDTFGIGRTMKVSKEQIVGFVVALQRYAKRDHKADMKRWTEIAELMAKELSALPHVQAKVVILEQNPRPICIPKTEVTLDEKSLGITTSDVVNELINGEPRIAVVYWPAYHKSMYLNPQCLLEGEERIVVGRIKEILTGRK